MLILEREIVTKGTKQGYSGSGSEDKHDQSETFEIRLHTAVGYNHFKHDQLQTTESERE